MTIVSKSHTTTVNGLELRPSIANKIEDNLAANYIKYINYFSNYDELEEPETLGEVTGNKGKSRGSDPLGVFDGDGCK